MGAGEGRGEKEGAGDEGEGERAGEGLMLLLEEEVAVDAGRELLFVVRHHDKRLVRTLAEGLDDVLHLGTVGDVKAMKRFVEDEELGILHEGACQKDQALLAT